MRSWEFLAPQIPHPAAGIPEFGRVGEAGAQGTLGILGSGIRGKWQFPKCCRGTPGRVGATFAFLSSRTGISGFNPSQEVMKVSVENHFQAFRAVLASSFPNPGSREGSQHRPQTWLWRLRASEVATVTAERGTPGHIWAQLGAGRGPWGPQPPLWGPHRGSAAAAPRSVPLKLCFPFLRLSRGREEPLEGGAGGRARRDPRSLWRGAEPGGTRGAAPSSR